MAKVIALAIITMAYWPAEVEAGGAGPNNGCRLPKSDSEALVNLDRWVTHNEPPPPSRYPRLGDGSAVPASSLASSLVRFFARNSSIVSSA